MDKTVTFLTSMKVCKCLSLFYIALGYLLNWFAFSIPSAEAGLNLVEGDIVIHGVRS